MNNFYTDKIELNYIKWWEAITSTGNEKTASDHSRECGNYQEMLRLSNGTS